MFLDLPVTDDPGFHKDESRGISERLYPFFMLRQERLTFPAGKDLH
jgi:hypothetical protein